MPSDDREPDTAAGARERSVDVASVLLHGALAASGLSEAVDRADRDRHAGRHAEAAAAFEASADALPPIARPMAEVLRRRAADAFEQAGDHRRASAILRRLARDAFERDAPHAAGGALREAARIAGQESAAEIEAQFAWEEWTDDPESAIRALDAAVRSAAGDERWTAAHRLSSILLLEERWADVVELGRTTDAFDDLRPGDRLALALNVLDAHERMPDLPMPDADVEGWAAAHPPEVRALVRQRAGVRASYATDLDRAVEHFTAAIELWGRAGGRDEQAVEAFEARETARNMLGQPSFQPASLDLTGVRDAIDTHAGRARRLEQRALRLLGRDQLIESRAALLRALEHHVAGGDLRGEMRVRELLAKLLEGGGRTDEAVWWAVSAGDVKRVTRLAANGEWPEMKAALRPGGPPWQRAAGWAALSRVGTIAPPDEVLALRDRLLADAQPTPDVANANGPGTTARQAVAAVVVQLAADPASRDRALATLRDEAQHGQWAADPAARALELVTELGISDETDVLADALLGDNGPAVRNAAGLIIGMVDARAPLRDRVAAAAVDGDAEAVEIAAYAGLDDEPLRARYRESVERLLADDGPERTTEQLRSYEPSGIFARFCDAGLQRACIEHLRTVALDDTRLLINRASAVRALGNAAPILDAAAVNQTLTVLVPLVEQPVGRDVDDPFARVRIRWGPPEMLAVAVVELAGTLAARERAAVPLAERAIDRALRSGRARLYAAAARAALRAPTVGDPLPRSAWLGHEHASVREWGLALIADRDRAFAGVPDVAALVDDPARRVRLTLVALAARHRSTEGHVLLERMTDDPDAEVRARAMRALEAVADA